MNNNVMHGFEFKNKQTIGEINSEAFEYVHQKTKATLFYIKNDDNNKAFTIGFRTPPTDSTGVAHIIEHSTLCGSDKYTTKEPFVDLIKGSLNTFLNAMTYPDKTLYPFSSQNSEDYKNILGIYLDAVFHPAMYKKKEIFLQEGWHYELDNKDADLSMNGVVYSEMKGSYSSPQTVLFDLMDSITYDNCYNHSSGGNPDYIPTLTYENFLKFHSTYYHPSNSCIYVYGNVDIDEIMGFIDTNYLSKYDYKEIDSKIIPTKPFNSEKVVSTPYSISDDESDENKVFASIGYVIPEAKDINIAVQLDLLADALFNADSAPIKNKILKQKLCSNISASCDNYKLQPQFAIEIQNTTNENSKKIFEIVETSLKEFAEKGIDKELLNSCIMATEFIKKESGTTQTGRGIHFGIDLINRFFYDELALDALKFEDNISKMYEMTKNDGFEQLLNKYIINNNFKVKVTIYPEKGLSNKKEAELHKKLQEYKNSLSDSEIENIIEVNRNLKEYQSAPETKENLLTIPKLRVEDLDKNIQKYALTETQTDKYTLYHHESFTNDVVYGKLMFDTSSLTNKELPYLGLLSNILSMMPTQNYTIDTLPNEIMANTGGISFKTNALTDSQTDSKYYKYFEVTFKSVLATLPNAIALIKEILFKTNFNDKSRLNQILNMIISKTQMNIIQSGHVYSMMRIASKFSPAYRYLEQTTYYTYFDFVKNMANNFDKESDNLINGLKNVLEKVLTYNNLILTVAGSNDDKAAFEKEISSITNELKATKNTVCEEFVHDTQSEGFLTSSNVQYVGMGYNFKELGYEYSGKVAVLATILRTDYLWNNVRVLGGAYGAMLQIIPNGSCIFASYRDPNLTNTFDVYRKSSEYVANLDCDKSEFTNYIIGTIADFDMPKTPEQKCKIATENVIIHQTDEMRQKVRDEILSTTIDDIKSLSKMVNDVTNKNLCVVFGNANKLKENKDLFDVLINS